jgi:exopolysaccharide biosynthesis polyprenyl glycosylphosphotransferase
MALSTNNSRLVQLLEALAVAGAATFSVVISTDTAVAEHTAIRVVFGVGMVGTWIALLAMERSADERVLGRGYEEFRRVLLATGRLLGAVAIAVLVCGIPLPRQTLAIAIGGGVVACLLVHLVNSSYLASARAKSDAFRTRVLLVGTKTETGWVAEAVSRDRAAGYEVVGFNDLQIGGASAVAPDVLGTPSDVVESAREHCAEAVVIATSERVDPDWLRDLRWALWHNQIDLMFVPDVAAIAQPKLRLERLGGLSLLRVDEPGYSSISGIGKAVFDALTAALILVMLSPMFVLVAAAIKIDDGGPVFYGANRLGLRGAPFRMWKFRSMCTDADQRLGAIREEMGLPDTAFFKCADDPRITRIGKMLRRTSLDELPQLLNVVMGEMSLIGPRPMVEGEGAHFPGFVERRMMVKPGMTGLWQVSGRSGTTEGERVDMDLYYVENWSMDQDLRILFKTAVTVARGTGAH